MYQKVSKIKKNQNVSINIKKVCKKYPKVSKSIKKYQKVSKKYKKYKKVSKSIKKFQKSSCLSSLSAKLFFLHLWLVFSSALAIHKKTQPKTH